MKTNKGFAGVGVILVIIAFAAVGGIAYYAGKNSVIELNKPAQNIQQVYSGGKLFDFFNTFTQDKDMGTPRIEFMYPEQKLILLGYATSQETGAYGVYDYKNDVLIKGVGDSYYPSGGRFPQAFVGNNMLLVYNAEPERTDENGNYVGNFVVQDFNNKIIKTLMTDVRLHQVYPKYGKIITIDTDTTTEGRFNLNTETLELSPWSAQY